MMRLSRILIFASSLGLMLILISSIIYAAGKMSFDSFSFILILGTIIWFGGMLIASNKKKSDN